MSMTQCLGRARLSLLIVSGMLGACSDDGSSSNEQAQVADAGSSTGTQSSRGGMTSKRPATGGNAANNPASAGRSGGAGQVAASAGRSAVSAGAAAPSGGSGGTTGTAGANAPLPDAGMRQTSDQDGGPGGIAHMILNDEQIAGVLSAVNTAETGSGTYAVMRATSPAVRAFAQSMVEMHNTAKERQTALFNTLRLTIMTSDVSAQLTDQATTTMTQLMSVIGTEFDAAYVRSQVEAHMQVLMIIDDQLLPNVMADALRSELVLTRTQVATHIDAARTALQSLEEDTDAGVRP